MKILGVHRLHGDKVVAYSIDHCGWLYLHHGCASAASYWIIEIRANSYLCMVCMSQEQ